MSNHQATVFVDYQQRASEFSVGDFAYPLAGSATDESQAGTVVQVWPGIGQVDIEFAWGSGRYPVEDVQRVTNIVTIPPNPENTTVPGGVGTVSVPGGPMDKRAAIAVDRVAGAYVKTALYWASKNRNYRGSKAECASGKYACPKCKVDEDGNTIHLRPANYKRSEGKSYRLLGCPSCLFLIKREDIIGDPSYVEDVAEVGIDAEWDGQMDQGFTQVRNVKATVDGPDRILIIKFKAGGDAVESMSRMMAYIAKIGGTGHSFGVVVDPDDPDYKKSFGFDGDGSDRILSVELDGKAVVAS